MSSEIISWLCRVSMLAGIVLFLIFIFRLNKYESTLDSENFSSEEINKQVWEFANVRINKTLKWFAVGFVCLPTLTIVL